MFLILPIGAERDVRRFPIVSVAIVALLLAVHLATSAAFIRLRRERENLDLRWRNETDQLMAAEGRDPGLYGGLDEVTDFGGTVGEANARLQQFSEERRAQFVEKLRQGRAELPAAALAAWQALDRELAERQSNDPYRRFGFTPAERRPATYLTHIFLHGSWLHLAGNILFFFFVGAVIEDTWGRLALAVLFLAGGAAAAFAHALVFPAMTEPAIGASGAVAAVMGAFAVRHSRTPVRLWYLVLLFVVVRTGTFVLPGIIPLGVWFAWQVFQGLMYRDMPQLSQVAFWAHVGGFGFGAAAAAGLAATGLEKKLLAPALARRDRRETFEQDPGMVAGFEHLERGRLAAAEAAFAGALERQPGEPQAARQLARLRLRGPDPAAAAPLVATTLADALRIGALEAAAEDVRELYSLAPEARLPPRLLLDLAQQLGRAGEADAAELALAHLAADATAGELRFKAMMLHGARLAAAGRADEAREQYLALIAGPAGDVWRRAARGELDRLASG